VRFRVECLRTDLEGAAVAIALLRDRGAGAASKRAVAGGSFLMPLFENRRFELVSRLLKLRYRLMPYFYDLL